MRAYHQIRCLSKQHEIILFALSDEKVPEEWVKELAPFCSSITIHYLKKWKISLRFLQGLFSRQPFQSLYHYEKEAAQKLGELVERTAPGKLFFQLLRTTIYAKNFAANDCIIDLMDCFSYHYLLRSRQQHIFTAWFYKREYVRIKESETALLNRYDTITIISEKDKGLLPGNKERVTVVPNGVVPVTGTGIKKDTDILFTGNLSYKPNISAAAFLCKQILPLLTRIDPSRTIVIAGANPSKKILSLKSEKVKILANVADIIQLKQGARVFVAPMFLNTGIQNKILEAMASRLPVVTTPHVAEAIGAVPGRHLYTAISAEEFVNQIIKINNLTNGELAVFTTAASLFIEKNYSWENNTAILSKLL